MASDTRLWVPSTHWRVPLSLKTGISLQVLVTGAGVQLLVKEIGGHPLQVPPITRPTNGPAHPSRHVFLSEKALTVLVSRSWPAHQDGHCLLSEQAVPSWASRPVSRVGIWWLPGAHTCLLYCLESGQLHLYRALADWYL